MTNEPRKWSQLSTPGKRTPMKSAEFFLAVLTHLKSHSGKHPSHELHRESDSVHIAPHQQHLNTCERAYIHNIAVYMTYIHTQHLQQIGKYITPPPPPSSRRRTVNGLASKAPQSVGIHVSSHGKGDVYSCLEATVFTTWVLYATHSATCILLGKAWSSYRHVAQYRCQASTS